MNVFTLLGKIAIDNSNANQEIDETNDKAKAVASNLDNVSDSATNSGAKIGSAFSKVGKVIAAGGAAGATAIASLTKTAVSSYAEYEQLVGGTQLMFGDAFATVQNNAQNAYQTVQMSQNEYLQQANGFATGLKTALGGNEQAAADLAHKIIKAEADIVAATGATQESVQNAFNGIMKSNFTMMDNLQIGITPTKEGFQEVIDKVNDWNAANGEATQYQMGNLADMQSALVDYIDMIGMSGYAQEEASGTISGSISSVKAAWSNLVTGMADDNANVEQLVNNLVSAASVALENLKPVVKTALSSIGEMIAASLPTLAQTVLDTINSIGSGIGAQIPLLSGVFNNLSSVVMGATAAFIAYKAATAISGIIEALTAATQGQTIAQALLNAVMNANPFVLIVTLIAGLIATVITLWNTNEDFRNAVIKIWDAIKGAFVSAWEAIVEAWSAAGEFFSKIWNSIKTVFNDAVNIGKQIIEDIKQGISDAWNGLVDWFQGIWNSLFGGLGADVSVNGSGGVTVDGSHASGLDYVPYNGYIAELHKGEMVVPAAEASYLRSGNIDGGGNAALLDAIYALRGEMAEIRESLRGGVDLNLNKREFGRIVSATGV